ncbi:hypothetical protein BDK92_6323 [Micromonospora pisi]|uniref:Outer membrane channel protein CpnT-like N-terminal domain-containing protein n=1 Tax=Micromonospora pisi TaxID=589240 RepID=A0A495JTL8_9ACTN|nr:hypothetical protein [Micromonospora pisi]RKR91895.1 hypothetical protein BDK92_6323 [Micromonospora pisi]
MTIPEPSSDFGLWPRVKAMTGWPEPDEVAMHALALGWRTGGERFAQAGRYDIGGLAGFWPDAAGAAFAARARASLDAATRSGESMTVLADRTDFFAGEVTRVKTGIRELIHANLATFATTGLLLPGAREMVQQAFVAQLAGEVNALIGEAAGRISDSGQDGYNLVEAIKDVGGVFKGMAEQIFETAEGLVHLPANVDDIAKRLRDDPGGFFADVWKGATEPIIADWKNGNQGEAIGRGLVSAIELVAGGKGIGKLSHLDDVSTPKLDGHVLFENKYADDVIRPAQTVDSSDILSQSGTLGYVVTRDGNLVVGRLTSTQGHIDLAQGEPVRAAGEFKVYGGEVRGVNNKSGHYRPEGESAQSATEAGFADIGIDISGLYKAAW